MPNNVQPGFTGTIKIAIDTPGTAAVLGVKTATFEETIAKHSTISTASPKVTSPNNSTQPVVQETQINGKTVGRLSTTAQYSAQGAADPPDFGGGKIYGNHYIDATIGDRITGYMLMERLADTLNVEGTIDYEMSLVTNGPFTRTVGT